MRGSILRRSILCALGVVIAWITSSSVCVTAAAGEDGVAPSVKNAPATHKQQSIIKVADPKAGEKLEDFCIDANGRILALLGPAGPQDLDVGDGEDGESVVTGALRRLSRATKKTPKFESAVHVFDADGKLAEKWPVGFSGQAINTAPDGSILIGGDGHLARFSADGKKLQEAESPQMTYINKNPEEMRERAKEQLESDRAMYADRVKQFEEQLKELRESKKKDKDQQNAAKPGEDAEDQLGEPGLKQMIEVYQQQVKLLEAQTVDQVLQQVLTRAKKTHSICADAKDVYVTCPAMAGYGYGVWRTDDQFGQAKEIVKSLSGCCGQMDVQCCNGELYVCENSRHRVIRFDRDGKQIAQFGKRDREGDGEKFGGCCNPMNLCFNKEGHLYVSESNGVVKHFTPGGEFLGIVGVAKVQPGCKNSCVAVTADDKRLYYIDIEKARIIVLARDESQASN